MLLVPVILYCLYTTVIADSAQDSPFNIIGKLDKLDRYLAIMARKVGKDHIFQSIYHGVITTANDQNVIIRRDKSVTCVGKHAILELRKGKRACIGGYFQKKEYKSEKICGKTAAKSTILINGQLYHCIGSDDVKEENGKAKCKGELLTDEELFLRCPFSAKGDSSIGMFLDYTGSRAGMNQWGILGKYNLGYINCDSGMTVSFLQGGNRYFCMGEAVHVVEVGNAHHSKCNDRQLDVRSYIATCGNNGVIPNEFERPVFINMEANAACPGKLTMVKDFRNGKLLGFCVGHTILVTYTADETLFCHGGVVFTVQEAKERCKSSVSETVYVKPHNS